MESSSKLVASESSQVMGLKVDPHKLNLFESRIRGGQGGIPSTFSPLRSTNVITPSHNNGYHSPVANSDQQSALSNMTDADGNSDPLPAAISHQTGLSDGASQGSCQTLRHDNKNKDSAPKFDHAFTHEKESLRENKPSNNGPATPLEIPSGNSKKKSTPNKRPASSISIGDRHSSPNSRSKRHPSEQGDVVKARKTKQDEKSLESTAQQVLDSSRDGIVQKIETSRSASRDTILYHYSSSSNQSKGTGSKIPFPPSLQAKPQQIGQKSTSQKTIQSFFCVGSRINCESELKVPSSEITESEKSEENSADVACNTVLDSPMRSATRKNKRAAMKNKMNTSASVSIQNESVTNQEELAHLQTKLSSLQKQLDEALSHNKAIKNNQTMVTTQLQMTLKHRTAQLEDMKRDSEERMSRAIDVIERLVRQQSGLDAKELRQKLASDGARLGRLVSTRVGPSGGMRHSHGAIESWEDGHAPRMLKLKRSDLKKKREGLERKWRELESCVANAFVSSSQNDQGEVSNSRDGIEVINEMDQFEAKETIRMHLNEVKKEEKKLDDEEEALNIEKRAHVRTLKLVAYEDSSKFRIRHKLHDRYILLNLLGKGGFSEVWRAYDLVELCYVAVKIHQLESSWSDVKKENYTKHVSREYEIHREVRHPRIVSLIDVFEIDTDSFATVLECCQGTDLDTMLKDRGRLVERDARVILLQILSGMRYLTSPSSDGRRQGIIHYDLKPGNILFDEQGNVKITDFGLSKIVDSDACDGMELTSQGAGTYWYLPPECFLMDQDVRISNKVDVWSIGVIYFQMLFGRRPFGDGESQDKILRNQTMLNATEVHFPTNPVISEEGKDFIRHCLTYDQMHRPYISQLCDHPYLRLTTI